MLVGSFKSERVRVIVPAAILLLAMLLFIVSCTEDTTKPDRENNPPETQAQEETTSAPSTVQETTGDSRPPEVTLGDNPGGEPDVQIRLEGDPNTTFSGLCSVGDEHNVLSGQVPKRFTFDLKGRKLSCRIEKRDKGEGDLKVVLVAGDATRSVQQTNSPDGIIKVSYQGG